MPPPCLFSNMHLIGTIKTAANYVKIAANFLMNVLYF